MTEKDLGVVSVGTIYVDVSCLHFPFDTGLMAHRETVGSTYDLVAGGSAFNFARLCRQLDLKSGFIGQRGQDMLGECLQSLVSQAGVAAELVVNPAVQTNFAIHYVRADGASVMTSVGSANQHLSFEAVQQGLKKLLPRTKVVYLGGCFKLKALLPHYVTLAQECHAQGVKVAVDHGRVNNSVSAEDQHHIKKLLAHTDYYLPSQDEFLALWSADSISTALDKAKAHTSAVIVVKDADKGVTVWEAPHQYQLPAYRVTVLNTVGAGDSFNAGFLWGLVEGKSIKDSAQLGNAVAATKISTLGSLTRQAVQKQQTQETL